MYNGCSAIAKYHIFLVLNVNGKVCFPDERQKIDTIGAHIDTRVFTLVDANLNPVNAHNRKNRLLNFNIDKNHHKHLVVD